LSGSRKQTRSRVAESLANHRADFPRGTGGTSFPGIPASARSASRRTTPVAGDTRHVYAAAITNNEIVKIDATEHVQVCSIDAETNPYGVAATPDGDTIFVTNSGASDVSVFD